MGHSTAPNPPMPKLTLDRDGTSLIPTSLGPFQALAFTISGIDEPIFALRRGEIQCARQPLVRIQSSCLTGEVFGSHYCDCADQLQIAMKMIAEEDCGLVIHLPQEGRGNGLGAKLRIYHWMQTNYPSSDDACAALGYPTDRRTYENAAAILHVLNLKNVRLLTNNPDKVAALNHYGISVVKVPLRAAVNEHNRDYLLEKQIRHHHDLGLAEVSGGLAAATGSHITGR